MSEIEEAARAYVDANAAFYNSDPDTPRAKELRAQRSLAEGRLEDAVLAERDETKKADDRARQRELRLLEGERIEGEPPLTKFGRVWESGSL